MQTIKQFFLQTTEREWTFFFAALGLALFCSAFVAVLVSLGKRRKKAALRRKAAVERNAEFTLPDKENEFVKERLKNHLKPQTDGLKEYKFSECVPSFDYTRSVLSKLKAAPLSVADRLQAQGISHDVTHFAFQERLSPEDVRVLNDRLAEMIKLSAKYSIVR